MSERRAGERVGLDPASLRQIRPRDLLVRFLFGAITSAISAGLTLAFGPRAGGLFLAFPATLAATISLIDKEDGRQAAREDARGAIVGAIALAAFAAAAAALFGQIAAGAVLAAASVVWAVVAFGLYIAIWQPRRGQ